MLHQAVALVLAGLTLAATWAWIVAHQLVLFYAFNFVVDQMPAPSGAGFYKVVYVTLHAAAANWKGRVIPAVKA